MQGLLLDNADEFTHIHADLVGTTPKIVVNYWVITACVAEQLVL